MSSSKKVQTKTNRFVALDDDVDMKEVDYIVYDANGNIDMFATCPLIKELDDAIKSGKSWYDIIYEHQDQIKYQSGWNTVEKQLPKKRKRSPNSSNKSTNPSKKPRYN